MSEEQKLSPVRMSIREMAVETRLLIQLLAKLEPGETMTYDDLTRAIGLNIKSPRARNYVNTAKRRLFLDRGVVVDTVKGVGLRRLAPAQLAEVGEQALLRIRNISKRAVRKMIDADMEGMTAEEKSRHLATVSGLALIAHASQPKQVAQLQPMVRQSGMVLPIGRMLEAFKKERE